MNYSVRYVGIGLLGQLKRDVFLSEQIFTSSNAFIGICIPRFILILIHFDSKYFWWHGALFRRYWSPLEIQECSKQPIIFQNETGKAFDGLIQSPMAEEDLQKIFAHFKFDQGMEHVTC